MLGGNSKKIDFVVEKSFLEAVEKQNKPREEVVCVDICDSLKEVFGEPASQQRRDLQEHWKNLKRRSIRSWAQYLDRFKVPHSETTKLLLQQQETLPSDDSDSSSAGSNSPSHSVKTPASTKKPPRNSSSKKQPPATSTGFDALKRSSTTNTGFDLADALARLTVSSPPLVVRKPPLFSASPIRNMATIFA